jgi:hypothetical protein
MFTTANRTVSMLCCLLLVSSLCTFASSTNGAQADDNLYVMALSAYLDSAAKKYANIKTKRDYDNLIVEKDDALVRSFPTKLGSHRVKFASPQELIERLKRDRSGIPITVIRPVKNEDTRLIVSLSEYVVTFGKKGLIYSLEGGCNVEIIFDCSRRAFSVNKVAFWGV